MADQRPVQVMEAYALLTGLRAEFQYSHPRFNPETMNAGWIDVEEHNWRSIAEIASNLGLFVGYFQTDFSKYPLTIFMYERESRDRDEVMKQFPPYTFKA